MDRADVTRIRVIGGPWPERIGLTGTIVTPTADEAFLYPFRGLGKREVVIHLPNDPIVAIYDYWTCVIDRSDVSEEPT